jgi:pimeloyl-ACP methyl ester carboxylesterase
MLLRLPRMLLFTAAVAVAAPLSLGTAAAQTTLVPAQDAASLLGGQQAQGAVIWSHGRSLLKECSLAPTPEYIGVFRAAGWDTFRLNRPRITDTLPASGAALAEAAETLKQRGYRRVVLAGQSFGAFISLIAAGRGDAVDAVIGTAPAAYGSAESNPGGFLQNASGLYDLLGAVRRARVALFFFDGDIFDPGGRGPVADRILAAHGLSHLVIDKPAGLSTHWAAAGTTFATQYASCLVGFAAARLAAGAFDCGAQGAPAQIAGMGGATTPSPAPARFTSLPQGNSASVIDLESGRREDVNRVLRRR